MSALAPSEAQPVVVEPATHLALAPPLRPLWARDERAFAEVFAEHGDAVHAVAARIATASHAEDITQEVFLRVWAAADRFDPARGSLRTYLLVITRNAAIDHVRAEQARHAREVRVGTRAVPPSTSVEDDVGRSDRDERIAEALAMLPPRKRDAIVTAFFGQLTYHETAVVLGLAEGTIKSQIRTGLRELHRTLHDV